MLITILRGAQNIVSPLPPQALVFLPLICLQAMDALVAKAEALRPLRKRKAVHDSRPKAGPSKKPLDDPTATSVSQHTALPRSLRPSSPPPEDAKKYPHIHNKKLRSQLTRQSTQNARAKRLVKDAELLLTEDAGLMEVEGELEKTWRVGQDEIVQAAGQQAAQGRQEWKLDGGPYRTRYTRNGRYVRYPIGYFSRLLHGIQASCCSGKEGARCNFRLASGYFTHRATVGRDLSRYHVSKLPFIQED